MGKFKFFAVSFLVLGYLIMCQKDNSLNSTNLEELTQSIEHTYPKTDGPDKNPLKGWNSGWWNNFEHSTVGFQYLKWKDFEPTNGVFNFDAVEEVLDRPGSRGRHFILRLYSDWYGENQLADGAPDWLYNELGVERLQNSAGKYVTDFNDPNFIKEVVSAIETLATHYDNDPRIYAVQIGVFGYWGEWHTFGFGDGFNISESSKNQIAITYKNSFRKAKIMGRYPWVEPLASIEGIGFHNDYFGPVSHSDEFDISINSNHKWLEGPIGGEIPPDLGSIEFDAMYSTNKGVEMVEKGHYSTMQSGPDSSPCLELPASENCTGFMKMHRKMGYNYQIDSAFFPERVSNSSDLKIEINISNIGVAPIYYDWDIQIAVIDNNDELVFIDSIVFDLRSLISNNKAELSKKIPMSDFPNRSYKLGIRIIQSGADEPKVNSWKLEARNTYILFSNDIPVNNGYWNQDNALIGGWSILGNFEVIKFID